MKVATARIRINKPLEAAGCRFFADSNGAANIRHLHECLKSAYGEN